MKAGWLVALLTAAAFAGCAGNEPANPNLAAPKLVIAHRGESGAVVFVHSAFGERVYDYISVSIDNETVKNQTVTFSIEEVVSPGFYLETTAEFGDAVYEFRGRIDVFPVEQRASVALLDTEGDWPKSAESFDLPFERLLQRRQPS